MAQTGLLVCFKHHVVLIIPVYTSQKVTFLLQICWLYSFEDIPIMHLPLPPSFCSTVTPAVQTEQLQMDQEPIMSRNTIFEHRVLRIYLLGALLWLYLAFSDFL